MGKTRQSGNGNGHTARLTPLEKSLIGIVRQRDPARHWATRPGRAPRSARVRPEGDPEAVADSGEPLLLRHVGEVQHAVAL